jgi:hypothetical protein
VSGPARHAPDLERQLLRKGVTALAADAERCADCHRTPLTGERVHLYDNDVMVCDLCRSRRKQAPERTSFVRATAPRPGPASGASAA